MAPRTPSPPHPKGLSVGPSRAPLPSANPAIPPTEMAKSKISFSLGPKNSSKQPTRKPINQPTKNPLNPLNPLNPVNPLQPAKNPLQPVKNPLEPANNKKRSRDEDSEDGHYSDSSNDSDNPPLYKMSKKRKRMMYSDRRFDITRSRQEYEKFDKDKDANEDPKHDYSHFKYPLYQCRHGDDDPYCPWKIQRDQKAAEEEAAKQEAARKQAAEQGAAKQAAARKEAALKKAREIWPSSEEESSEEESPEEADED